MKYNLFTASRKIDEKTKQEKKSFEMKQFLNHDEQNEPVDVKVFVIY